MMLNEIHRTQFFRFCMISFAQTYFRLKSTSFGAKLQGTYLNSALYKIFILFLFCNFWKQTENVEKFKRYLRTR
jgi:hypothetical protein